MKHAGPDHNDEEIVTQTQILVLNKGKWLCGGFLMYPTPILRPRPVDTL